jgi:hypothetical protein
MSEQKNQGGQQRGQGGQPGRSQQAPEQTQKPGQPKPEVDRQFDDDKLWEQGSPNS